MRSRILGLAVAIVLAPLGARAADLVVWWEKGFYAQEDEAVREIIAAFEQETGKQVELVFHPQEELPAKIVAALEAGRSRPTSSSASVSASTLRTMGLRGSARRPHGRRRPLLGPVRSGCARLASPCSTRRPASRPSTLLPMGFATNHVHVWKSLLEQAGFTLADIPKEWEAFWSFWCDQVQPAVRQALGPRRHLGHRPSHVGRLGRHGERDLASSCMPTRPTT